MALFHTLQSSGGSGTSGRVVAQVVEPVPWKQLVQEVGEGGQVQGHRVDCKLQQLLLLLPQLLQQRNQPHQHQQPHRHQ